MRAVSLFAGIGGFDLAFERVGAETVLQVEIEKFPRKVLAKHWPNVRRIEDIRDVQEQDVRGVDLVCGGFPCQDLSVAGKRAGLSGERSGLWWEMLRVVEACRPAWVLWENVPGLLNADGGEALASVCGSLADCGYFGAWRVLDSQHFGVPQRRRRVFGLFARGRAGALRAAEVLLVAPSRPWIAETSGAPGKDVAHSLEASVGGASGKDGRGLVGTLREHCRNNSNPTTEAQFLAVVAFGGNASGERQVETCLSAHGGPQGRLDFESETFLIEGDSAASTPDLPSLRAGCGRGGETAVLASSLTASAANRSNPQPGGACHTLPSSSTAPAVAGSGVRRLTPTECEALQAFPGGWTCLCDAEAELHACACPDGPRYKALGNAVTVNVVEWIARRIMES